MSFKETVKQMRELLANITLDLEKADNGNKAASQRVRTGTVRLEKIAKLYRKESIASEKKNKGQRKPAKPASKVKASGPKTKSASKGKNPAASSKSNVKASPKAKSTKASFRPRQLSIKRATAKLPNKRLNAR
jgi:hypothetical protein